MPHYHVSRWINLLFRRLVTCWLAWIWSCVFFIGLKSGKRLADKVGNYIAHPQMVLGSISDFYLLWTWCVGKERKGTKRNGCFYFRVLNIRQGLLPVVKQRDVMVRWMKQDSASLIFFRSNQLSGAPPGSRLLLIPEVWLVNQRKPTPTVAFSASHMRQIAPKAERSHSCCWFTGLLHH